MISIPFASGKGFFVKIIITPSRFEIKHREVESRMGLYPRWLLQ
jgi:hypothetical protein